MVGLGGVVLLAVLVGIHTVVAAVGTRLLRVRFSTDWGTIAGALVLLPMVLVASTFIVSGMFGLGPNLGGPAVALFLLVVVPIGLGLAIDYLWMPAPEDVTLPAEAGE